MVHACALKRRTPGRARRFLLIISTRSCGEQGYWSDIDSLPTKFWDSQPNDDDDDDDDALYRVKLPEPGQFSGRCESSDDDHDGAEASGLYESSNDEARDANETIEIQTRNPLDEESSKTSEIMTLTNWTLKRRQFLGCMRRVKETVQLKQLYSTLGDKYSNHVALAGLCDGREVSLIYSIPATK